jgi:hypothetical protein
MRRLFIHESSKQNNEKLMNRNGYLQTLNFNGWPMEITIMLKDIKFTRKYKTPFIYKPRA